MCFHVVAWWEKLGHLISCLPDQPNFRHGHSSGSERLAKGDVYMYCIDDRCYRRGESDLQTLKERGLKLYACAYGAHRRNYPLSDKATFRGIDRGE